MGLAEKIAWLCEVCPEFFRNVTEETLDPERFPEHRVLADFVRRRDRTTLPSGKPLRRARVSRRRSPR
jgi:hypothetical protein